MEYICASDEKTYPNECQARRTACMTKSLLKTVHKGKCGKIFLDLTFYFHINLFLLYSLLFYFSFEVGFAALVKPFA